MAKEPRPKTPWTYLPSHLWRRLGWKRLVAAIPVAGAVALAAYQASCQVMVQAFWDRYVSQKIGSYRIYVTVVGPHGERPGESDRLVVTSSVGGELKRSGNTWEIELPARRRPAAPIDVTAVWPEMFLSGSAQTSLGANETVAVTIALTKHSIAISGFVVDEEGTGLEGVRVMIADFPGEAATTDATGSFALAAHAAAGEAFRLLARKRGFEDVDQLRFAGDSVLRVTLHRRAP